jgi:Tol biopolymer transport system component
MYRQLAVVTFVAAFVAACGSGALTAQPPTTSPPPAATASPIAVVPTATTAPVILLPGRILFHRAGSDGVERYFTVNTDGSDEKALFTREGCQCAHWSADGTLVLTLDATDHGTYSFMTIRPDGTDRVMVDNPIKTLNLAPGASSADGRRIAFQGWDETNRARSGLYIASPGLVNLRLVMPLQAGMLAVEPFAVTPDGSRILFFADTGPDGGTTHAGHNFVINADGSGLRQLDPPGAKAGFIGPPTLSMSPDGRRVAFEANDGVYVADLETGEGHVITDLTGVAWAVAWSPAGDWIAYTRQHGGPPWCPWSARTAPIGRRSRRTTAPTRHPFPCGRRTASTSLSAAASTTATPSGSWTWTARTSAR